MQTQQIQSPQNTQKPENPATNFSLFKKCASIIQQNQYAIAGTILSFSAVALMYYMRQALSEGSTPGKNPAFGNATFTSSTATNPTFGISEPENPVINFLTNIPQEVSSMFTCRNIALHIALPQACKMLGRYIENNNKPNISDDVKN